MHKQEVLYNSIYVNTTQTLLPAIYQTTQYFSCMIRIKLVEKSWGQLMMKNVYVKAKYWQLVAYRPNWNS